MLQQLGAWGLQTCTQRHGLAAVPGTGRVSWVLGVGHIYHGHTSLEMHHTAHRIGHGEVEGAVKSRPEPQHARPQRLHSLALTHEPRKRQTELLCAHLQKAGSLILLSEKHALGIPVNGAHRLIVTVWSAMGCEMSRDLALAWCLPDDNTLGKGKLPEQAEMLWSSWP